MIDFGVAGFRVDAAKHVWVSDLQALLYRLNDLNQTYFPANSKPFIYSEVGYFGGPGPNSGEYVHLGRIIEFRYMNSLRQVTRKLFNQRLEYLKNFGEGWGFVNGEDAVVFVDNHDSQRGQVGNINEQVSYRYSRLHKMSTAFMLAWPFGIPRVMSSYYWDQNIQVKKIYKSS